LNEQEARQAGIAQTAEKNLSAPQAGGIRQAAFDCGGRIRNQCGRHVDDFHDAPAIGSRSGLTDMDRKPQQRPTQKKAKAPYHPPRLTSFGKLHTLVAAGSSGAPEGMSGKTNKRG